ncbi:unnamed protein product [Cladocopium goreaui]|uniref:Uncharacterized protein n=1 Tax=Cladocopium goreaui TaxID=2562237 RepID=A0A9P1C156_9DINO|nr:unnamed protein product [Cladocopium goreaui]
MEVSNIRFTQEHVYDTFNANSDRAGSVLDLMESILSGEKTPWDIPLIRVAAKKGAYWCVDNRRLFTYKHLQLGKIPVQVFGWKENREFELKYRNGLPFRQQTSNGLRAGLIQRSERAFPRSSVAEPSLSKFQKLFTKAEQRKHEARIAELRRKRDKELQEDKDADAREADASLKAVRAKRKVRTSGTLGGKKRRVAPKIEEKDKKLTVTLDKEDSEEDDFAIEISAP